MMCTTNMSADCEVCKLATLPSKTGRAGLLFIKGTLKGFIWAYMNPVEFNKWTRQVPCLDRIAKYKNAGWVPTR